MKRIFLLWLAVLAGLLVFVAIAHAGDRDPALEKFARKWADRLDLYGWSITVEQVSQDDLGKDTMGDSNWDDETRSCRIRVLSTFDYVRAHQAHIARRDQRDTIVHELVHVTLSPLRPAIQVRERALKEEFVVDKITAALCGGEGQCR